MSRPLTNTELIQQLLELRQPHAVVEVQLEIDDTTNGCCHDCGGLTREHNSHAAKVRVVGVRSTLGKVVLEVVE